MKKDAREKLLGTIFLAALVALVISSTILWWGEKPILGIGTFAPLANVGYTYPNYDFGNIEKGLAYAINDVEQRGLTKGQVDPFGWYGTLEQRHDSLITLRDWACRLKEQYPNVDAIKADTSTAFRNEAYELRYASHFFSTGYLSKWRVYHKPTASTVFALSLLVCIFGFIKLNKGEL